MKSTGFNTDLRGYSQWGRLFTDHRGKRPALFENEDGALVVLEDSARINYAIPIGEDLIVGYDLIWKCYHPAFVAAGYRPASQPYPMAIWNIRTGARDRFLKGSHTGSLRGALRLDKDRLITWARDFTVKTWHFESGELLETCSVPVAFDDENRIRVDSRNGQAFKVAQWEDYLSGQGAAGFYVSIILKPTENETFRLGPISSPKSLPIHAKGYQYSTEAALKGSNLLADLNGAELGYAQSFALADGRICFAGGTYGAREQAYVWDGLAKLTLLIPYNMDVSSELVAETEPNTIRLQNHFTHFDFFKV